MKRIIVSLLLVTSTFVGFCQEIEVSGTFAAGRQNELYFRNGLGYSVTYNQLFERNYVGLSYKQFLYTKEYDEINTNLSDGTMYTQTHYPKNKRYAVDLVYAHAILANEKSTLNVGCNVGLNFFSIDEEVRTYYADTTEYGEIQIFSSNKKQEEKAKENFKIGFGAFIEYEIKELFSENISTYIRIHPETVAYKPGLVGSHDPLFVNQLNFTLGLRYTFAK